MRRREFLASGIGLSTARRMLESGAKVSLWDVNADLRMTGLTEPQIRRSLNGTAQIAFRDGALKGVNLASLIRKAKSALGAGTTNATSSDDRTDFSEFSGSATITQGLLTNKDLMAKSPFLRVDGSGQVSLVRDGAIGPVRHIKASFGFRAPFDPTSPCRKRSPRTTWA